MGTVRLRLLDVFRLGAAERGRESYKPKSCHTNCTGQTLPCTLHIYARLYTQVLAMQTTAGALTLAPRAHDERYRLLNDRPALHTLLHHSGTPCRGRSLSPWQHPGPHPPSQATMCRQGLKSTLAVNSEQTRHSSICGSHHHYVMLNPLTVYTAMALSLCHHLCSSCDVLSANETLLELRATPPAGGHMTTRSQQGVPLSLRADEAVGPAGRGRGNPLH